MFNLQFKSLLTLLPLLVVVGCAAGTGIGPAGKMREFFSPSNLSSRHEISNSHARDERNPIAPNQSVQARQFAVQQAHASSDSSVENVLRSPGNSLRDPMLHDPMLHDPMVKQASCQQPVYPTAANQQGSMQQANRQQSYQSQNYADQNYVEQNQYIQPYGEPGQSTGHFAQGPVIRGQQFHDPQTTATEHGLRLQEENSRLQSEISRLTSVSTDLQFRLTQALDEVNAANSAIALLQQESQNQIVRNTSLQQDINQLRKEKSDLVEQSRALIAAVEQSLDEILFNQLSNPVPAKMEQR